MTRLSRLAALWAATALIGFSGCDDGKVELAKEAPKVDVPPSPDLPKRPGGEKADKKDVRPTGGSGSADIQTYGSK